MSKKAYSRGSKSSQSRTDYKTLCQAKGHTWTYINVHIHNLLVNQCYWMNVGKHVCMFQHNTEMPEEIKPTLRQIMLTTCINLLYGKYLKVLLVCRWQAKFSNGCQLSQQTKTNSMLYYTVSTGIWVVGSTNC